MQPWLLLLLCVSVELLSPTRASEETITNCDEWPCALECLSAPLVYCLESTPGPDALPGCEDIDCAVTPSIQQCLCPWQGTPYDPGDMDLSGDAASPAGDEDDTITGVFDCEKTPLIPECLDCSVEPTPEECKEEVAPPDCDANPCDDRCETMPDPPGVDCTATPNDSQCRRCPCVGVDPPCFVPGNRRPSAPPAPWAYGGRSPPARPQYPLLPGSSTATGRPNEAKSCQCIELYAPVCGADGKVYANDCFAGPNCANTRVLGACGKRSKWTCDADCAAVKKKASCQKCGLQWGPTCGIDGKVYSNACLAGCQSKVAYGCNTQTWAACAKDCKDADTDGCFCPTIYMPVCTKSGKVASNACEANCAKDPTRFECSKLDAGVECGRTCKAAAAGCACGLQGPTVCALGGRLFPNACYAKCAGAIVRWSCEGRADCGNTCAAAAAGTRRTPPPQAQAPQQRQGAFVAFLPRLSVAGFKRRQAEYVALVRRQLAKAGAGASSARVVVAGVVATGSKFRGTHGVSVVTRVSLPAATRSSSWSSNGQKIKPLLARLTSRGCAAWLRPKFGARAACRAATGVAG